MKKKRSKDQIPATHANDSESSPLLVDIDIEMRDCKAGPMGRMAAMEKMEMADKWGRRHGTFTVVCFLSLAFGAFCIYKGWGAAFLLSLAALAFSFSELLEAGLRQEDLIKEATGRKEEDEGHGTVDDIDGV